MLMKKIKNRVLAILLIVSGSAFAQGKPEKFSSDFLNCFLNYKEACAKDFISSDTTVQKEILGKLDELYKNEVKPDLKGKSLSSSTRAVLKDGDAKHKQIADIFIQITADKTTTWELSLWGCYVQDGKWLLGDKIEMKKN
jgi:hypothetical protein